MCDNQDTENAKQAFSDWWLARGRAQAAKIAASILWQSHQHTDREDVTSATLLNCLEFIDRGGVIENRPAYVKEVARNTASKFIKKKPRETTLRDDITDLQAEQPSNADAKPDAKEFMELLVGLFIERLNEKPQTFARLVKKHNDPDFLFWYLNKCRRVEGKTVTLEKLITLFGGSTSRLSERIKAYEKDRVIRPVALWSYQNTTKALKHSCLSQNLFFREDMMLQRVAAFFSSKEAKGRLKETVEIHLWLTHHTEPHTSLDELEALMGLSQKVLKKMMERAYPIVLLEYLNHQKQPLD